MNAARTAIARAHLIPRSFQFTGPPYKVLAIMAKRRANERESAIAMAGKGPRNDITDVPGLCAGSAIDTRVRTGVTVILPDAPAIVGGDVRGGGPGTRETDLLDPRSSFRAALPMGSAPRTASPPISARAGAGSA
jgi:hypothetical protein